MEKSITEWQILFSMTSGIEDFYTEDEAEYNEKFQDLIDNGDLQYVEQCIRKDYVWNEELDDWDEDWVEVLYDAENYDDYKDTQRASSLTESKDPTYIVCSYYDEKLHGLEDELKTDDWSEVEDFAHRKLMQGNMLEIENTKTGKYRRINPDEYDETFDGEFIVRPEELEEAKELSDEWKEKMGNNVHNFPEYEFRALRYAEIYGIVDYEVKDNIMTYTEEFPYEGTFEHKIDLDTMEQISAEQIGPGYMENKEDDEDIPTYKEAIKSYNTTDYGYHNNSTTVYGELLDGNWFVFIPDNEALDVYDTAITDKFIDTMYNYDDIDAEDDVRDDGWYDNFQKEHNITNKYDREKLDNLEVEVNSRYFNMPAKVEENKKLNEYNEGTDFEKYTRLVNEIKLQAEENGYKLSDEDIKRIADKMVDIDNFFYDYELPEPDDIDNENWKEIHSIINDYLKSSKKEEKYRVYAIQGGDGVYNSVDAGIVDTEEQAQERVSELGAETGNGAWYEEVDEWWEANVDRLFKYIEKENADTIVDMIYGGNYDEYWDNTTKQIALDIYNQLGKEETEKLLNEFESNKEIKTESKEATRQLQQNYKKTLERELDKVQKEIENAGPGDISGLEDRRDFLVDKIDQLESDLNKKEESKSTNYEIEYVIPNYTGGNIYNYTGKLKDGNYFMADDSYFNGDNFDVTIVSSDPDKEKDDGAWYPEWQEEHLVEYLDETRAEEFTKQLLQWILKNKPEGNYDERDMENMLNSMSNKKEESKSTNWKSQVKDIFRDMYEVGKPVDPDDVDRFVTELIDEEHIGSENIRKEMTDYCLELLNNFNDLDMVEESNEIEQHRNQKLDKLNADIRYNFEEAYKDWGKEVSKTKLGFVNEYMSEYCNDYAEEVNWKDYIVAIPELDKLYAQYKDIENWEIPEDVKAEQYKLITDYVQNYLNDVYGKKEESKMKKKVQESTSKDLVATGLSDAKAKDVLNSVIGQMSDGIWENTSQMNRYWNYANIVEQDGELFIKVDRDSYGSGYYGKSDDEVRKFFANKVKQIAKEFINDYHYDIPDLKWDRNCTVECSYLDYNSGATIQDGYRVYDKLLGRIDRIKTESKKTEQTQRGLQEEIEINIDDAIYTYLTTKGYETDESAKEFIKDYVVIKTWYEDMTSSVSEDIMEKYLAVEVRAELDYDSMATLSSDLDKVVQKYDASSYFDFITGGIIRAYIQVDDKKLTESIDTNKVVTDFQNMVKEQGIHVTRDVLNEYMTDLFENEMETEEDMDNLNEAESWLENYYGLNEIEEYDDETNWSAEEESDALDRFEQRYMSGGNGWSGSKKTESLSNKVFNRIKSHTLFDYTQIIMNELGCNGSLEDKLNGNIKYTCDDVNTELVKIDNIMTKELEYKKVADNKYELQKDNINIDTNGKYNFKEFNFVVSAEFKTDDNNIIGKVSLDNFRLDESKKTESLMSKEDIMQCYISDINEVAYTYKKKEAQQEIDNILNDLKGDKDLDEDDKAFIIKMIRPTLLNRNIKLTEAVNIEDVNIEKEKEKVADDIQRAGAKDMIDTEKELLDGIKKEIYQYTKQQGLDLEKLRKQGIELESIADTIDSVVGDMVSKSAIEFMDQTGQEIAWDYDIKDNDIQIVWKNI